MVRTTVGASGPDDGWGGLTPEQRRALLRSVNSPGFQAMARNSANISRAFADALAPLRKQQEAVLAAARPQIRTAELMAQALGPLNDIVGRFQRELVSSLNLGAQIQASRHASLLGAALGQDVADALRRVHESAFLRVDVPRQEDLAGVGDLLERGDIDEEDLGTAEESIASDEALAAAVDHAVDVIAQSRPLLSRAHVRRLVVGWVYLMWAAGLIGLAVVLAPLGPAAAAAPGAVGLGAPQAGSAAGKGFDRLFPPDDDVPADPTP